MTLFKLQAPNLKQPPPMAMISPTLSSSTSSQKKGDLSPGTPCSQCLRESNGHAGNGSANKLNSSISPSGMFIHLLDSSGASEQGGQGGFSRNSPIFPEISTQEHKKLDPL